ncbi:PREDICTED: grancalcin isoform X2 [Chinchilla lanigera]|uniref:grancalcin isoform X2 n=1 Tax=Chinchilla lanigera TaxID=34839 RepID=UPI000695C900|nr:PREDICTED: grancalcin isoform X2 [Chinchilla lanigera]
MSQNKHLLLEVAGARYFTPVRRKVTKMVQPTEALGRGERQGRRVRFGVYCFSSTSSGSSCIPAPPQMKSSHSNSIQVSKAASQSCICSLRFGNFHAPSQGIEIQIGQPVPGVDPHMCPGGYQPGYTPYPGSCSSANDSMWTFFTDVAGQDGEVDAEELQKCLTESGISGSYSPFSLETCRIMIAMLDRDNTGKMGFNEFKELWAAINAWKQNFLNTDQDRSGSVEHHEFSQAIAIMGYRLSPQTLNAIVQRYSKNGRIFFDDYVACCVKLRALTDFFRRRDHLQQGSVNFMYEDFLQGTMKI